MGKNNTSSHPEKSRGISDILGRFWPSWGGFWPPGGMLGHPRDALPEKLEPGGTNIPIPAGGNREVRITVNGADTCHRPQQPLGCVTPHPGPLGDSLGWAVNIGEGEASPLRAPLGAESLGCVGCSAPPARHRRAWSHVRAMQARPSQVAQPAQPQNGPFSPQVGPHVSVQSQQCPEPVSPGSRHQRGPWAPTSSGSGQRDTSLSKGKLRQEAEPRVPRPRCGVGDAHPAGPSPWGRWRAALHPPAAPSQRHSNRGVPRWDGSPLQRADPCAPVPSVPSLLSPRVGPRPNPGQLWPKTKLSPSAQYPSLSPPPDADRWGGQRPGWRHRGAVPGPRWQGTMLAVMESRYFKRFCFRVDPPSQRDPAAPHPALLLHPNRNRPHS